MIDSIDMMRMLELNEVMDGQSVSVIYENSCVVSTDYRHVDRQTGIPLLSRPTRMNIFVYNTRTGATQKVTKNQGKPQGIRPSRGADLDTRLNLGNGNRDTKPNNSI